MRVVNIQRMKAVILALWLTNSNNLVRIHRIYLLHYSTWPVDFKQPHLWRCPQARVHPFIARGEVTSCGAHVGVLFQPLF